MDQSSSVVIAHGLQSTIQLKDGHLMPMYGLGTYKMPKDLTEKCVKFALGLGYRLIDNGQTIYENEVEFGRGMKTSGVPREDIYLVSKISTANMGRDQCTQSVHDTLRDLDVSYIDLFLIHAPVKGKVIETYDALLDLQQQGLIRSVGVSNFDVHHLEGLREAGRPTPVVNQIELHPFFHQQKIVDYCRAHDIVVNGYSPLARMERQPLLLQQMAQRYNRSVAQILLRWSVQMGYVTIPMAFEEDKIIENAEVFDFEITPGDLQLLDTLELYQCSWNPMAWDWEG